MKLLIQIFILLITPTAMGFDFSYDNPNSPLYQPSLLGYCEFTQSENNENVYTAYQCEGFPAFLHMQGESYFRDLNPPGRDRSTLNFTTFNNLIRSGTQNSMEQLLTTLKNDARFGDRNFFKHYTLMFRSESLHEASVTSPRAIVFGSNAKFIITFNGRNDQSGYANLELMYFDDTTSTFRFREVGFKGIGARADALHNIQPNEIDFENRHLYMTKDNPSKCLGCHGTGNNLKPAWHQYSRWPGAFGEEDDYPVRDYTNNGFYNSGMSSRQQEQEYRNFRIAARQRLRYNVLENPVGTYYSYPRPNSELTFLINDLNSRRLAAALINNRNLRDLRSELLIAAHCPLGSLQQSLLDQSQFLKLTRTRSFGTSLASFFISNLRYEDNINYTLHGQSQDLQQAMYEQLLPEFTDVFNGQFSPSVGSGFRQELTRLGILPLGRGIDRFQLALGKSNFGLDMEFMAAMKLLSEQRRGMIPTEQWSSSPGVGSYMQREGFTGLKNTIARHLRGLLQEDATISRGQARLIRQLTQLTMNAPSEDFDNLDRHPYSWEACSQLGPEALQ